VHAFNGSLTLRAPSSPVMKVFTVTGLTRVFDIEEPEEQASTAS
jgi:anti-anti-sigma regulatory factor